MSKIMKNIKYIAEFYSCGNDCCCPHSNCGQQTLELFFCDTSKKWLMESTIDDFPKTTISFTNHDKAINAFNKIRDDKNKELVRYMIIDPNYIPKKYPSINLGEFHGVSLKEIDKDFFLNVKIGSLYY